MITIFAEKPDVGNKIAAALDKITLHDGREITFAKLKANEKAVKSQQFKDGYLKIKYLGEDCYVTWGYGHLCSLKEAYDYDSDYKNWNKLPIPFIPANYEVKAKSESIKQFNLVCDLMRKSSLVINATDYDREGEVIFAYVYELGKIKTPFKRAHFSSQTEEGIKEGFVDLLTSKDVENITNAGKGRTIADAVIGWNMTAKMTLKTKSKETLSIGRVQTPTLSIIVERELAIRNFKPEKYFTITAEFKTKTGETYKGEHKAKRLGTIADAKKIFDKIDKKDGIVTNIETKLTNREAPNLYSLSSLQMDANSKYGFTLDKTLDIAQQLYESGYTTYPRTDSQFLTEDMVPTVNEVISVLATNSTEYNKFITGKGKIVKNKKYFDDKKVKSHFAIIPTKNFPKSLTPDQEKIYDLVARSVIMMLYSSAVIENTKIMTTVEDEEFVSNGKCVKDPQWMVVDTIAKDELLPKLTKGDKVSGKYKLNEKETEPPRRFTDKTLLNAMLNAGKELDDEDLKKVLAKTDAKGIGTEATRAEIVKKLINSNYIVRNKKNISPTERGIQLIQILPIKELKSAELTALWEKRLDDIANGKDSLPLFIKDIEDLTRKWVKELEDNVKEGSVSTVDKIGTCPACGKDVVKTTWGYGCTGWKEGCKFGINKEIAHKKITEANVKKLLTTKNTGIIKGFTSNAGKSFDAALMLNEENKVVFDFGSSSSSDEETRFICPKCGKKVIKSKWSYKCEECDFSVSKTIASKEISETQIGKLIKNGQTDTIKGFTSKAGKPFDAKLKLDDNKKVVFDFS